MRISLVALVGLLLITTPALAATRADRGPRDGSSPAPSPVVSTPAPTAPHASTNGIYSSANATTNSGGNQGGNVVTGNQTSTVTVINIGPTQGTQVTPPAPTPEPQCQDTRRGCSTRTR